MASARRLLRAIPSVVVAVLVVAAAAAQSGPANPFRLLMPARRGPFAAAAATSGGARTNGRVPAPAAATGVSCRGVTFTASTYPPAPGTTVIQPDAVTITASHLSFVLSNNSGAAVTITSELSFYDPNSSDPGLSSYPLARGTLTASGLGPEVFDFPLDRQIVVRGAIPSPVTTTAALSYRSGPGDFLETLFEPNGPPQYRPAMFNPAPGIFFQLPGGNPVLGHEVCGASEGDDGLYVLQQVVASHEVTSPTAELVQTFTCPITVTAEWVELAVASTGTTPLEVSIFDLQGALAPGEPPVPVTTTSTLLQPVTTQTPVWAAATPLTITARLEAGHRYGLAVKNSGQWSLGAAGSPGGTYYEGGELYSRDGASGPFALVTDRDLSFRLIGTKVPAAPAAPPACDLEAISRSVTVTAQFSVPPNRIVVQPLTINGSNFAIGRVTWSEPEPVTITVGAARVLLSPPGSPPLPDRIALRNMDGPTYTCCDWSSVDFAMPLVVSPVSGVAQGAGDELSLSFRSGDPASPTALGYDEASSSGLPPALFSDEGTGMWQPLPGLNPVLAHVVCPATVTATTSGPWRVVQQVLEAGHLFHSTETGDVLQTFRVPVPTEVSWAELGLRATGSSSGLPFGLSLMAPGVCTCTALGGGFPLVTSSVRTSTALLSSTTITADMRTTELFPSAVTLTPGVDYWLRVTPTADYDIAHSNASSYAEGRLYRSPAQGVPLAEESDRDLAFRLIGVERPLMANRVTPTACPTCPPLEVFAAVTTTAGFGTGGGPRALAQVSGGLTGTAAIGGIRLPLGADAQSVTITVRIRHTEDDVLGVRVPSSSGYPLTNVTITAGGGDMNWTEAVFDRPLVMREKDNPVTVPAEELGIILEPPPGDAPGRAKVALGGPGVCTCTALENTGAGWQPLPGLALGRLVLPSTRTADEDLCVLAAVHAVDGSTLTADIVQVFRVPEPTRLAWVELAVPEGQEPAPPFTVSVVDPQGLPAPQAGALHAATMTAQFPPRASMALGSTWAPTDPVAAPMLLLPGRDYWVQARLPAPWRVASAVTVTATDIGKLYTRPPGDGPWTEVPGALAMRLIGKALGTTDVPRPIPSRGFMLSADPQPFTRELSLRWSGGTGRMSVEIFDAGGRRVRFVRDAGLATQGAWTWRGEGDDGRTVRAGVYFARVTPSTGPALHRRVVYLR